MLSTTVGHKDHFYTPSQNPGGLTVFSDVDNTLVMGGGYDISYNQALLNGMINSGIREMYLCTSMSLSDASINSEMKAGGDPYETREDIIKHCEQQGVKVLGAFTTSDLTLYAGQQAKRNGTFPTLQELLDRTKEYMNFSPEKMEALQPLLENAYEQFSDIMSKDTVMGQYYAEIVAPNYVKGETTRLSQDPNYEALVVIDRAFDFFYKQAIDDLMASKGYEESKTLMADIIQTESAMKGVPISKYMMFDDSKYIVEDITKAAPLHDAAAINIIMTKRTERTAATACITEKEITSGISNAMYNMGIVPLVANDLKDILSNIGEKLAEVNQKARRQNYLSRLIRSELFERREQRRETLTTLMKDLTNAGNDLAKVAEILHSAATNPVLNRAVWQDFTERLAASSNFMSSMDLLVTQRKEMQASRVPIAPVQVHLDEDNDLSEPSQTPRASQSSAQSQSSTPPQTSRASQSSTPPQSPRQSFNPLFISHQREATEQRSKVKENIRMFENLAAASTEQSRKPKK